MNVRSHSAAFSGVTAKYMFLFSAVLLLLCGFISTQAEGQWHSVLTSINGPSAVYHGIARPDGSIYLAVTSGMVGGQMPKGIVVRLNSIGELEAVQVLDIPEYMTVATHLFQPLDTSRLIVAGTSGDWSDQFGDDWMNILIATINANLDGSPVVYDAIGPSARNTSTGDGYIAGNGDLILGHYNFQDFNGSDFEFWATRWSVESGMMDSTLLLQNSEYGKLHAIVPTSNGTSLAAMPAVPPGCSPGFNGLIHLDGGLDPDYCYGMVPIAFDFQGTAEFFQDNLSLISLPNSDLLISGMYTHVLSPSVNPLCTGLQLMDSVGSLITQRSWIHPQYNAYGPAVVRGLAVLPTGDIYTALCENYQWGSAWPEDNLPSNIRVIKLDPMLNVLGEYVIEGIPFNKYYNLNTVLAAHDGGLFVMGSVYDLNDTGSEPHGWIAKVTPEQFVTVPEHMNSIFHVFPNPGSDELALQLAGPVPGGRLHIIDLGGRKVIEHSISGLHQRLSLGMLPSGIFLLRLVDERDVQLGTARWVKQ